jgi:hypothetical protein
MLSLLVWPEVITLSSYYFVTYLGLPFSIWGLVDNLEYGNFEILTSKKCFKSRELSSPLSAYSYCREGDS